MWMTIMLMFFLFVIVVLVGLVWLQVIAKARGQTQPPVIYNGTHQPLYLQPDGTYCQHAPTSGDGL